MRYSQAVSAMTGYGLLFDYLWVAPHVLLFVIAVIMIHRKLVREFPAFFAYIVYEVLQFVVLVYLGMWNAKYMRIYLAGSVVSCLLRFAVMYEIFEHLFRHYPAVSDLGRRIYRWTASVLLLVSVVAVASQAAQDYLSIWLYTVDRGASIIQCGLLITVFAMSRFLRFSWRNHAFGIALGLGMFASVELVVRAMQSHLYSYTAQVNALFNYATMGTYHVCVLIWAIYLWMPEREYRIDLASVPVNVLDNWDAALQRVLER